MMIRVYHAAVSGDIDAVTKEAPRQLLDQINTWKRDNPGKRELALLVKNYVLNDNEVRHVPPLIDLRLFDADLLKSKPSLVRMHIALIDSGVSDTMIEKALSRAMNLTDQKIGHHACDITNFVRQLSNRDDHRVRKRR